LEMQVISSFIIILFVRRYIGLQKLKEIIDLKH
jgi:hypothetical protein